MEPQLTPVSMGGSASHLIAAEPHASASPGCRPSEQQTTAGLQASGSVPCKTAARLLSLARVPIRLAWLLWPGGAGPRRLELSSYTAAKCPSAPLLKWRPDGQTPSL
ncbi:hypothetical protein PHYPSEUDO_007781 [Phytophthora pseudosyringae]|uniref:Uncharacterized protein n=1 Tax=Phytophthora pseudosyringae TaxID=221518 RepID=A0A8T1VFP5_9STRA|nr:hypothetical protein PHYPSEUDO_007781 [Phytophthora pseudosyringae]